MPFTPATHSTLTWLRLAARQGGGARPDARTPGRV